MRSCCRVRSSAPAHRHGATATDASRASEMIAVDGRVITGEVWRAVATETARTATNAPRKTSLGTLTDPTAMSTTSSAAMV